MKKQVTATVPHSDTDDYMDGESEISEEPSSWKGSTSEVLPSSDPSDPAPEALKDPKLSEFFSSNAFPASCLVRDPMLSVLDLEEEDIGFKSQPSDQSILDPSYAGIALANQNYTWTLTEDAHNSVIPGGPPKMLLTQTYQRTLASVANNRDSSDVDELASTDNTSDASHRAEGHIAKHQRKNAHTPIDYGSDIEIVDLPKRLFLPKITAPIPFEAKTTTSQSSAKVPRVPMGPARRAMEQINMETYLWVAHIDTNDMDTCKLLKKHKITHWSFFRSSDKDDLMALGFSIGAARSLWEGVPRLEEYVDDLDHNRCVVSPPASSHL
ncbi:hypothetical protein PtB15_2B716 [Puccinia triticina]|nr:hypothetical protein PtB15_2B716 [Puccinia triticina]